MVYAAVNGAAFSIQLLVRGRLSLAGRLLLWGLVFRVPASIRSRSCGIEPWHHATMLLPSGLLCNRPDKEEWLLISAAQRLRTSGVSGKYRARPGPSRRSFRKRGFYAIIGK